MVVLSKQQKKSVRNESVPQLSASSYFPPLFVFHHNLFFTIIFQYIIWFSLAAGNLK